MSTSPRPRIVLKEDEPILVRQVNPVFNRRNFAILEKMLTYVTLALVILTLISIESERSSRTTVIDRELQKGFCRSIRLYPNVNDPYAQGVRKQYNCPPYNPNAKPPPSLVRPSHSTTGSSVSNKSNRGANGPGLTIPPVVVVTPSVVVATSTNPSPTIAPTPGPTGVRTRSAPPQPRTTVTRTRTASSTPKPSPTSSPVCIGGLVCVPPLGLLFPTPTSTPN